MNYKKCIKLVDKEILNKLVIISNGKQKLPYLCNTSNNTLKQKNYRNDPNECLNVILKWTPGVSYLNKWMKLVNLTAQNLK